jgi:hypothetical protein
MSIFRDFFAVKQKPIFTGLKFGFGAGGPTGTSEPDPIEASGGTTTYIHGGYKVHCYYNYTPSPEKVFNVTSGTGNIEVFMIGGGGTGNYDSGGGGGGGAAVYGTGIPVDPSMNMAITVEAGAPSHNGYMPGSEPTADYLNDHGGKPAIIAHPGGNIVAHGGNPGGTSLAAPYGVSPISPGLNQSDGLLGCGGGAHKSNTQPSPVTAGALISSYPTPSAGTFTVHRNVGGSIPSIPYSAWAAGGGGGAGGAGGATGNDSSIPRLFRVDGEAGDGGIGYDAATNITWMTTAGGEAGYFGGGGGAGGTDPGPNGTGGQKGLGGGGAGDGQSTSNENATNGTDDTGGGGGGGDGTDRGKSGGAGAVFIAYEHTAPTPGPYGGTASGGNVTAGIPSGDYRYFVINSDTPAPNSNLVLSEECPADNISILLVGGGGGGGSGHAGGGGAGGVCHLDFGMAPIPSGTHSITAGGAGTGGPTGNPNIAGSGSDSTFGPNPSKHYMVAKGGGGGGGWIDSSADPAIGRGINGGSGGGSTGTAPHSRGYNLCIPSTQRAAGRARHYGNPGGYGSYAGGGGGGAGTLGQTTNQGPPGIPSNPPNIPADHPNYPGGGGGGNGPFGETAPYESSPNPLLASPFNTKIWPSAADHQASPTAGGIGGWGGWGASFPEFPGPVIGPGIASPKRTNWQNAVGPAGIFAGGGGGGSHTASGNPYTYKGGGMGGVGGGGSGGEHAASNAGQAAIDFTGSGGGGAGNQPEAGGAGGRGICIIKIKMS